MLIVKAAFACGDLAESSLPGKKRRKPKVVATISYDDLTSQWHQEQDAKTTTDAGSEAGGPTPRPLGGALDTDLDRSIVPAAAVRRMACDCNIHRYITNPLPTPR